MKDGQDVPTWAIAGGKGGVGKSLLVALLAEELAARELRVVAVDLDLAGCNLHGLLGVPYPEQTLGYFFADSSANLSDCLVDTVLPNVKLISGAGASRGGLRMPPDVKLRFLSSLKMLNADVVLLDLGAGAHFEFIDPFILANHQILVTTGEPTSIQNAYSFLKSATLRLLELSVSPNAALHRSFLREVNPENLPRLGAIENVLDTMLGRHSKLFATLRGRLAELKPSVVANQVLEGDERRVNHALGIVCRQYLGFEPEVIAALPSDPAFTHNIRRMRAPVSIGCGDEIRHKLGQLTDALVHQVPFDSTSLLSGIPYASDESAWLETERRLEVQTAPNSLSDVLERLPEMESSVNQSGLEDSSFSNEDTDAPQETPTASDESPDSAAFQADQGDTVTLGLSSNRLSASQEGADTLEETPAATVESSQKLVTQPDQEDKSRAGLESSLNQDRLFESEEDADAFEKTPTSTVDSHQIRMMQSDSEDMLAVDLGSESSRSQTSIGSDDPMDEIEDGAHLSSQIGDEPSRSESVDVDIEGVPPTERVSLNAGLDAGVEPPTSTSDHEDVYSEHNDPHMDGVDPTQSSVSATHEMEATGKPLAFADADQEESLNDSLNRSLDSQTHPSEDYDVDAVAGSVDNAVPHTLHSDAKHAQDIDTLGDGSMPKQAQIPESPNLEDDPDLHRHDEASLESEAMTASELIEPPPATSAALETVKERHEEQASTTESSSLESQCSGNGEDDPSAPSPNKAYGDTMTQGANDLDSDDDAAVESLGTTEAITPQDEPSPVDTGPLIDRMDATTSSESTAQPNICEDSMVDEVSKEDNDRDAVTPSVDAEQILSPEKTLASEVSEDASGSVNAEQLAQNLAADERVLDVSETELESGQEAYQDGSHGSEEELASNLVSGDMPEVSSSDAEGQDQNLADEPPSSQDDLRLDIDVTPNEEVDDERVRDGTDTSTDDAHESSAQMSQPDLARAELTELGDAVVADASENGLTQHAPLEEVNTDSYVAEELADDEKSLTTERTRNGENEGVTEIAVEPVALNGTELDHSEEPVPSLDDLPETSEMNEDDGVDAFSEMTESEIGIEGESKEWSSGTDDEPEEGLFETEREPEEGLFETEREPEEGLFETDGEPEGKLFETDGVPTEYADDGFDGDALDEMPELHPGEIVVTPTNEIGGETQSTLEEVDASSVLGEGEALHEGEFNSANLDSTLPPTVDGASVDDASVEAPNMESQGLESSGADQSVGSGLPEGSNSSSSAVEHRLENNMSENDGEHLIDAGDGENGSDIRAEMVAADNENLDEFSRSANPSDDQRLGGESPSALGADRVHSHRPLQQEADVFDDVQAQVNPKALQSLESLDVELKDLDALSDLIDGDVTIVPELSAAPSLTDFDLEDTDKFGAEQKDQDALGDIDELTHPDTVSDENADALSEVSDGAAWDEQAAGLIDASKERALDEIVQADDILSSDEEKIELNFDDDLPSIGEHEPKHLSEISGDDDLAPIDLQSLSTSDDLGLTESSLDVDHESGSDEIYKGEGPLFEDRLVPSESEPVLSVSTDPIYIKESVSNLLERSIRESVHHALQGGVGRGSVRLSKALIDTLATDVDPWTGVDVEQLNGLSANSQASAPPPLPNQPDAETSPAVALPVALPDPPHHPVRVTAQTVISRWGELYLETMDCAPTSSKFRVRIITEKGVIWFSDQPYNDLLDDDGIPRTLSALSERFERLHDDTRRMLLRKGIEGLDGFVRIGALQAED